MTDKELLELAAKAAKAEVIGCDERKGLWIKNKFMAWNPLTDDGDALRLAVKLSLWEAVQDGYQHLDSDGDIGAATRRSIVRAAAKRAKNDQPKA